MKMKCHIHNIQYIDGFINSIKFYKYYTIIAIFLFSEIWEIYSSKLSSSKQPYTTQNFRARHWTVLFKFPLGSRLVGKPSNNSDYWYVIHCKFLVACSMKW